jgi:hypothetical protein
VVLRLAARLRIHPKGAQPHPIRRSHDKMRNVVRGQPILQIRRQQKRLITGKPNIGCHPEILPCESGSLLEPIQKDVESEESVVIRYVVPND